MPFPLVVTEGKTIDFSDGETSPVNGTFCKYSSVRSTIGNVVELFLRITLTEESLSMDDFMTGEKLLG